MPDIVETHVFLGSTQAAVKLILHIVLAASVVNESEFFSRHVKIIRLKQKLVELDSGDGAQTVREYRGCKGRSCRYLTTSQTLKKNKGHLRRYP